MTSVKQPTSCNPPPRQFGPRNRRGALLKSTTLRWLFGQNRRGGQHTTSVLAKQPTWWTTPRRFWPNNRCGVFIFLKKNYKLINL